MKNMVGSIWRCIDKDDEQYGRLCVIKEYSDNPDYNGDGDIELRYVNGVHYGKVRRFVPNYTHKFIRYSRRNKNEA
jgi:hypothetical protein